MEILASADYVKFMLEIWGFYNYRLIFFRLNIVIRFFVYFFVGVTWLVAIFICLTTVNKLIIIIPPALYLGKQLAICSCSLLSKNGFVLK